MAKPRARLSLRRRGFALVVTISLMILLTILAVGLLTLSTIALRSTKADAARAEARANARLALMLAIGEIQAQLGKDQVATAQATILVAGQYGDQVPLPAPDPTTPAKEYTSGRAKVNNPHWLGAFPTYDPATATTDRLFYIRRPTDTSPGADLYLYDSRYCNASMTAKKAGWQWDRIADVQWLVSNPAATSTTKMKPNTLVAAPLLGTADDFKVFSPTIGTFRGPLLYPATSSSVFSGLITNPNSGTALACMEARAPIVPLKDANGNFKGGYAWMVADDSLKYKISPRHAVYQTAANAPSPGDGSSFAQLLAPQNSHLEGLFRNGSADPKLQKLEYGATTDPNKYVSLSTLPLGSTDATFARQAAIQFTPFFQHTFTAYGYGLLTDPVSGGLKRNLTSYLERPSTGSNKNKQVAPIKPGDATELGAVAGTRVQDSISDTSSLLLCLKDKDPQSSAVTPGSMTTSSDPEKRLTWFAPVFGLLRDYTQLRNPPTNTATNLSTANPVIDARAVTQARGLFQNRFGSTLIGWDGLYQSTAEPSAMTSWDANPMTGTYTADAYAPGSGTDKQLAPSMGVHPVLVKATAYMYPAYDTANKKVAYLVYPRVVLYNPYNVKLAGRKYVVSIKRNTNGMGSYYRFSDISVTPAKTKDLRFDISNGAEIQGTLAGNTNDLVFLLDNTTEGMMPGESLLFCPDASKGTDVKGGGKYAKLYKAIEGNIDKMVLSSRSRPGDGAAFYATGEVFDWGSGSTSTVMFYSGGYADNSEPKHMVKLFMPASGTNFASPLNTSLTNYSLLQAVEAVGRYERIEFGAPGTGVNALPQPNVPELDSAAATISDPRQFDLKWLHCGWVGMRLVRAAEVANNSCLANSFNFSMLQQYDIRAPYVGHTCDITPKPDQPTRMVYDAGGLSWYSEQSTTWVPARDGTTATVSDPLHVLSIDTPLSVSSRSGLNVMSAFMRTGTISASAANCPMFELPRKNTPLVSLAELRNAHLGAFFATPTYVIGNSYGTRLAPRSASAASWDHLTTQVYAFTNGYAAGGKRTYFSWLNYYYPMANAAANIKQMFLPFHYPMYDYCYEANHSLWDRFFLTGVEGDPSNGQNSAAAQTLPSDPKDSSRVDPAGKLPNPRLVVNPLLPKTPMKGDVVSYFKASENLVVDGAFNVNCTDYLAWQSLLSSFRKINPPLSSNGSLDVGDKSPLSRVLTPPLNRNGDPTGLTGSGPIWQQIRCLTDAQIETLSKLIVEQVKRRAPFISVSDFVNRRLVGGDLASGPFGPSTDTEITKWGIKGALQTAIDDSGVNGFTPVDNDDTAIAAAPGTRDAYNPTSKFNSPASSKYADALGYLNQSDILAKIGSVLTVRGDTFTIRAYGDSRDSSGKLLASERCEATIQRIPSYVDTTADPVPQAAYAKLTSDTNRRLGRQYKIIAFRWLAATE